MLTKPILNTCTIIRPSCIISFWGNTRSLMGSTTFQFPIALIYHKILLEIGTRYIVNVLGNLRCTCCALSYVSSHWVHCLLRTARLSNYLWRLFLFSVLDRRTCGHHYCFSFVWRLGTWVTIHYTSCSCWIVVFVAGNACIVRLVSFVDRCCITVHGRGILGRVKFGHCLVCRLIHEVPVELYWNFFIHSRMCIEEVDWLVSTKDHYSILQVLFF